VLDPEAYADQKTSNDKRRALELPTYLYTRSYRNIGDKKNDLESLPSLDLGPKVKLNLNF